MSNSMSRIFATSLNSQIARASDLEKKIRQYTEQGIRYNKINQPIVDCLSHNQIVDRGHDDLVWSREGNGLGSYKDRQGRINYAFDGEPRSGQDGWLIEPPTINAIQYSEELTNPYWAKTEIIVEEDASASPYTGHPADHLVPTTTNGQHYISTALNLTITEPVEQATSLFVKPNGYNYVHVQIVEISSPTPASDTHGVIFDIVEGRLYWTTGNQNLLRYFTVDILSNGWVRVKMSSQRKYSGNFGILIQPCEDPATATSSPITSFTGDGTKGVYVWGVQYEALPMTTSYMLTVGEPTYRYHDDVIIKGVGNFPESGEPYSISTILRGIDIRSWNPDVGSKRTVFEMFSDTWTTNYSDYGVNKISFYPYYSGEIAQGGLVHDYAERGRNIIPISNTNIKDIHLFVIFTGSGYEYYINGEKTSGGYAGVNPPLVPGNPTIRIGGNPLTGESVSCHVSDFRIYDFALTEQEVRLLNSIII